MAKPEPALPTTVGPEALSSFWLPLELAGAGTYDGTFTYPGTDRQFPSEGRVNNAGDGF